MFRSNTDHLQGNLFSTLDELPAGVREMLEMSWAGTFRQEIFMRLDESPFAILYSEAGSRPNVPVNVLVGLEILKAGFGWTDEEMYHEFLMNLQVRYALGYENLGDGYFAIRTVYNFRDALSRHMQETSEMLIDSAFNQVTDEQVAAFELSTSKLRMDSTQIASDIRQYSRLQLLIEVLQRVNRMLNVDDQSRYGHLLIPYCKGKSSHYVYRLKNSEYSEHLSVIGEVMHQLVLELSDTYGEKEPYQILTRLFGEHFVVADTPEVEPDKTSVQLIPAKEISAASLQSPDDPDATFRTKSGKQYRGYVANVTETCDPDNDFQLILKTQTESNLTDDAAMLVDVLPELVERTDVDTMATDGGYNSPDVDPLLDLYQIDHIQSAIRGGKPDPGKVGIADFIYDFDQDGIPIQATCPQGQTFSLEPGRSDGRYIGRPDADTCAACPFFDRCQAKPKSGSLQPTLYLDDRKIRLASKRQQLQNLPQHLRSLRPAVEATVRSIKHPFRHGKILLRGKFRITSTITASAFMVNVRRIHRAKSRKLQNSPAAMTSAIAFALQELFSTYRLAFSGWVFSSTCVRCQA